MNVVGCYQGNGLSGERRIYSPTMDFCLSMEGLFAFLFLFILFFIYKDG